MQDCSSFLLFLNSCDSCTRYFNRLDDFIVTIYRSYKDVYVNSLFPCTARL